MLAILPETLLLGIAKHRVEGRQLQVASGLHEEGKAHLDDKLLGICHPCRLKVAPRPVHTYRGEIVSDLTNLPPKQTPLYGEHLKLGAKMIDFGGWNMPVYLFKHHRGTPGSSSAYRNLRHFAHGPDQGVGTIWRAMVEYVAHQ